MASSSTWNSNDTLVPKDNPTVARIMEERGIGRRRAYALAKKQAAEAVDVSNVTLSQKEAVLATLVNHPDIKNAGGLYKAMHAEGSTIDGHDVAKMLWACQKMGWVKFRESPKRGLYAIKVTDQGYDYASKMAEEEEQVAVEQPVAVKATLIEQARAVFDGPLLADYPHIQRLLADYDRQQQLAEAARLLEEAGEDDISLMVMERTSLTELDKEVVRLARSIWKEVS